MSNMSLIDPARNHESVSDLSYRLGVWGIHIESLLEFEANLLRHTLDGDDYDWYPIRDWLNQNAPGWTVAGKRSTLENEDPEEREVVHIDVSVVFTDPAHLNAFAAMRDAERREWEARAALVPAGELGCLECGGPLVEEVRPHTRRFSQLEITYDCKAFWCDHCGASLHGEDSSVVSSRINELLWPIVTSDLSLVERLGSQLKADFEIFRERFNAPPKASIRIEPDMDDAAIIALARAKLGLD